MNNFLRPLFGLFVLSSLNSYVNAQYFTHNWSHEIGNVGPGYLTINSSCITNQDHYITVGKVSGTVDVDPSSSTYFVSTNHITASSYGAFFAEYDSSTALVRAFAISPLTNKTSFDAVAVDDNGNIYIAGGLQDSAYLDPYNSNAITSVNGLGNVFIAKYDPSMHLLWVKSFANAFTFTPKKIVIDHQNNIILAGDFNNTVDIDPSNGVHNLATYSSGSANSDAFLAKFDQNGLLLWAKNLGTTLIDVLGGVAIDLNDNIYIGVNYEGNVAFIDSLTIINSTSANFTCISKFNTAGQVVWNKPIASPVSGSNIDIMDLTANNVGEVFLTGVLRGNAYFQNPSIYLTSGTASGCDYIAKLAVSGNCIWAYAAYTDISVGYSIGLDEQSNIYLSGTFIDVKDFDYKTGTVNISSNPSTTNNHYLASYDSTGGYRWAFRLASTGVSEIKISNTNGKVWMNGSFNSNFDVDPSASVNTLNMTNSTEFVANYTLNGSYQFGFAFKGSGTSKERVTAMDVADNGNVIVAGMFTGTIDLDHSANNLIYTSSLDSNVYIASYSSTGALNWANQIKGRSCIKALAIDNDENIYVTGYFTLTTYFDVNNSPSTYYTLPGGVQDIFLIKYNSSGVLQWIHTFGSSLVDEGRDIAIDNNGNVIMVGMFKTLIDFDPSATGTFNLTTPQSISSCYVAKYDANGNFINAFKIVAENITSVAVDNNNNIITNGNMEGFGNFNVQGGNAIVYTTGVSGDFDYYLAKYDSAGVYQWAFKIGNLSNNSAGSTICTDQAGNIYFNAFMGNGLDNIDIDPGPDSTFLVGNKSILVKYSTSGNLLWGISTGTKRFPYMATDNNGNPTIISEYFNNVDLDPSPASVVLAATNPACLLVRYSSVGQYLNAQLYEATNTNAMILPSALKITSNNSIYIGGYYTGLVDFDAAPGYQNLLFNNNGLINFNGFIASLNQPNYLAQVPPSAAFNSSNTNFCEGVCINFNDNSLYAPNNWNWSFPGATPASSTTQNPQGICYNTPGSYDVQLIVSNPLGADTLLMTNFIVVDAIPQTNAGGDIAVCEGSSLQLNGSGATNYSWSPSSTLVNSTSSNPIASPLTTTTYTLTGTNGSCSTSDDITITVNPNPSMPTISPVSGELQSTPAYAYQWYYNGVAINGATLQNLFPTQIGNYTVTVFDSLGCFASSNSYLVTVVGIKINELQNTYFTISPNPINNQINIISSKNKSNMHANLYDMQGKLISTQIVNFEEGNNILDFPAETLNSGLYRLELKNGNEIHSLKILKLN
ncbi:MAG TPA: T9SS type A sorting domain-containing protein [Bacteroidia bacterium]|nr:T9SS type A sorting domain-containing protein [Bacteroidia bacterium]